MSASIYQHEREVIYHPQGLTVLRNEEWWRCHAPGRPGTPSTQRRGIDSPVAIRRGDGAQMKWGRGQDEA